MIFGDNTESFIRNNFSLDFYRDKSFLQELRGVISKDTKEKDMIRRIDFVDLSSYKSNSSGTIKPDIKHILVDPKKDLSFYKSINEYNEKTYLSIINLIDLLHEAVHIFQYSLLNGNRTNAFRKFLIDSYNVKSPVFKECFKRPVINKNMRKEFYDVCYGFFFFERQAYYESSVFLLSILKDIISSHDILEDISRVQVLYLLYPYLDASKQGMSPIEFFYDYAYDVNVNSLYNFSRFSNSEKFMLGDYLSNEELVKVLKTQFFIDENTSNKLILGL